MTFSFARLGCVSAGAALGIAAVTALCHFTDAPPTPGDCDEYRLLNPFVRCEPDENLLKKKEFGGFKQVLEGKIFAWIGQGRIDHASVYVRDLQFGPWMGIEEDETYGAASLLKVGVMLAVLRQEELHPGTLKQNIGVTAEMLSSYAQDFAPQRHIAPGNIYTVDQLLEYMIVESDNDATNVLNLYLESVATDGSPLMRTFEELGFITPGQEDDSLTVKQSASMFRLLYNASYLSKESSHKALALLSRTKFTQGLRAGVPDNVPLAHKFGERLSPTGVKQLHDCGIVYHPDSHYLVCIMTRGNDTRVLAETIATISKDIYDEMTARAENHLRAPGGGRN